MNAIRHFQHTRKGLLVGEVVGSQGEWMVIRITEPGGYGDVGEEITVRKSFLTELDPVTGNPVEVNL